VSRGPSSITMSQPPPSPAEGRSFVTFLRNVTGRDPTREEMSILNQLDVYMPKNLNMSRVTLRNATRVPDLLLRLFMCLADKGINLISAVDLFTGWTILHYVAAMGYTDVAEDLLIRGASASAADPNGQTPLSYAQKSR